MRKRVLLLISLLLAVFTKISCAESYIDEIKDSFIFTSWSNSGGFPTNNALDVYQNSQNYIWIATYDGLVRFNGKEFKLFNKYTGEGFNSASATVLFEDSKHRLWIGTNENGIGYYQHGKFSYFNATQGFNATAIRDITQDQEGNIWVTSVSGLTKFIDRNGIFEIVDIVKDKRSFNHFLILKSGEMLLTTIDGELMHYDGNELKNYFSTTSPLVKYKYQTIMQDTDDNIWFGLISGEIIKIEPDGRYQIFSNKNVFSINKILEIVNSKNTKFIVFCSDNGIGVFNKKTQAFDLLDKDDGLFSNSIESMHLDKEKNFWFASKSAGLEKVTLGKFKNYKQQSGFENTIVNAIEQGSDGNYWIGTNGGLSLLTSDNIFVENKITDYFKNIRIRHLLQDSHNTLWVGTYNNKALVRVKDNEIRSINVSSGLTSKKIRVTLEDSRGWLWVGTTSGLFLIKDPQAENFVIRNIFQELNLPTQYILSLTEDKDGNIIAGSNGHGIYILTPDFKIENLNTADGLSGDIIFKVFIDSAERLWIATNSGLSLWQDKRFFNFNTSDGLQSNSIYQIIEDNDQMFWLTSSKGVATIAIDKLLESKDKKEKRLDPNNFNISDGFLDSSTATSWGLRDSNGKLWFPTLKGISVLDKEDIYVNEQNPTLVIDEIDVDKQTYLPQDLKMVQPNTKRISFKFSALSFSNPEKVKYKHFLSNFDDTWSEPSNEKEITYTNLPPGDYIFHVKASNRDGVWSDAPIRFAFTRKPAFNETIYYQLLVVLVIIGIVACLFLLRIKNINDKRRLFARLLEDTITALTAAIDAKDPYTKGHSQRVSEISVEIGKVMGLSKRELSKLRYSALLHDIGKIGIEDRILVKPGKLTDEEFKEIQKHPGIGGEILSKGSLIRFSDGAKYHHVRYSGAGYGYDNNFSGDDIPLFARIIAVADVYDALRSDRPYRKGREKDVAHEIIKQGSGEHFDPKVVNVFNQIINDFDGMYCVTTLK